MRSMRFFHPMVRPGRLSRVDLATFCAHCSSLMEGLRARLIELKPHATHGGSLCYSANTFSTDIHMKWILLFLAIWNVAGALLRTFRLLLEKLPLTRRLYPNRDLRPLNEVSELELSHDEQARYCTSVRELSKTAGIPEPQLLCSPKSGVLAGTRGWRRHQLQLSRGALRHTTDEELLAILAHEFGHIYYRHYAALRMTELFAAAVYARVVFSLWHASFAWYAFLGIWSLLDFSYSLFRLSAGSVTELMADHYAANKLGLAGELSRGLMRAQCVNGATDFNQITHFYPTVKLRIRLLERYARAMAAPGYTFD
jgi:Zn-dependent protease with chaperone function